MGWQTTPFTVPLLTAGLASFALAGYAVAGDRDGSRALVWTFCGIAVGGGVWASAYALQLSAVTVPAVLFWNRFVWVGVGLLAVAWPAFVLTFVGRPAWHRPARLALLAAVPVSAVAAVWVLGPTPLFYRDPALVAFGDGPLLLSVDPGPGLIAVTAYTHAVNLLAFVALAHAAVARAGVFRRQAVLLLVAGVVPTAVGLLFGGGPTDPAGLDPTPVSFVFTSGLVAWVLFRYRLFDRTPIAREAVVANLSDGVVVVDGDERVVDANDRARELFPALSVGRRLEAAVPDAPAVVDVVRTGDGDEEVGVTVEADSGTRFLTVSTRDLARSESAAGVDGTVLLARDVTDRRALRRRYRALIEKSPNVIAVCGPDGVLRYASPSLERLLGQAPASVEGRPAAELVHPDDRTKCAEAVARVFETGRTQVVEHRAAHANGDWRTFETTVEPLFEETGDEVVITATDVTETRRHEQRLQVLNRVLRHDLKNDATVIGGYVELLRDHVESADGDDYLDVIDRKVETLTHLSDQAREIDVALHDDSARAAIDLTDLTRRLCDDLERSFPEATVTLSAPDSAVVSADNLLESAVRNLLENAVIHNDAGGATVEVTVGAVDDGYRVEIADDGPGIPPVERSVFSEGRETALEHASGLGLWLVHWIVTGSGGDVDIDSRQPTGTVVGLWLPAAETPATDADSAPGDANDGGARSPPPRDDD